MCRHILTNLVNPWRQKCACFSAKLANFVRKDVIFNLKLAHSCVYEASTILAECLTQIGNHQASLPSPLNHQAVVTYRPSHLRLLPNIVQADGVPFHSEVAALDAFAKSLDLGQDLLSKHHRHL